MYVEFWRPRIGNKAATNMWWSRMVVATVPKVVLFNFIVVAGSVRLHYDFAYVLAWVIGVSSVAFAVSGGVSHLLSRWEAGRAIGIKVGSRTFPPVDENAYLAWCREHGVKPFGPSQESTSRD
jgi:hypothetical protein